MGTPSRSAPDVVIKRLPRYYRYLSELLKQDVTRISSGALSRKMGVTASQIRQDFNYFGGFGQQGYGYNVKFLYDEIESILGLNNGYKTIIVGAGNIGRALAKHSTFEKRGFKLAAIFDNDNQLVGKKIKGVRVQHTDALGEYVKKNRPEIGILTVPKAAAQPLTDIMTESGIKGILNFSYSEILVPEGVSVENVHLSDYLMRLAYKIKVSDEADAEDKQ